MDQERSANTHHLPLSPKDGTPWSGFLHSAHRGEDVEPLVRTLRFASIQLNKFWVEFNAFPVFMNEMKGASIRQIEKLFDWFQAVPSWSSRVTLPRLVPELCNEASRAKLLEFTARVVRARTLRAQIGQRLGAALATDAELVDAIARLDAADRRAGELGLLEGGVAEAEAKIAEIGERLERNGRLQAFFARLATDGGLGAEAGRPREAGQVFHVVELARHTRLELWKWRRPQILAPQSRERILAWYERSRPLLEARARLSPHFRMEERVAAAQLNLLAEKLRAGGLFRAFSSGYKAAFARYRELLKLEPKAKAPKESRIQMAERLEDWAEFLTRRAQVEDSAEAKSLFAPHFRGIDTDFEAALEANAWAENAREELGAEAEGADFSARLADSLFSSPQEKLLDAVETCSGSSLQAVQGILAGPDYAADREFAVFGCEEEGRWIAAGELKGHLDVLAVKPVTRLSELAALRAAASDLLGLLRAIEAGAEARAAFKQAFAGERTDLGYLAAAQDYIDFVYGSSLSDGLKASFLTAHGPQRLQDTRSLVAPALAGLAHVKEHLRRLEAATHGASVALEELPLLDLLQKIQAALKQPSLLAELVSKQS